MTKPLITATSPESARKAFAKLDVRNKLSDLEKKEKHEQVRKINKSFFLILNSGFYFDWEKKIIEMIDDSQSKKLYCDKFRTDIESYDKVKSRLMRFLNQRLAFFLESFEMKEEKISFPEVAREIKENSQYYLQYSPLRILLDNGGDILNVCDILIKEITTISFIKHHLKKLNNNPEKYNILQPKISGSDQEDAYIRDRFLTIDGNIFMPHLKTLKELCGVLEVDISSEVEQSFQACLSDLKASGYNDINNIPFFIEGGNCVVLEDKKTILLCVTDSFFQNKKFVGASFVNEKDELIKCVDYSRYCDFIKQWGNKIGYKIEIIDRNLDKFPVEKIYHLDVFLNVADDVLVVDKEAVSPASFEKLQQMFGDKIIEISIEDRENLATNFIEVDGVIFLTSPKISQNVVEKLNEFGFTVVKPPFYIGMNGPSAEAADGLRCHTQIKPKEAIKIAASESKNHDSSIQ